MDSMSTTFSFGGTETKAKLKGRCKRCWGRLLARRGENRGWTGIRCRVCGIKIEGKKAQDEFKRMQERTILNLMNMEFGRAPEYRDAKFIQKIFPEMDSLPKEEVVGRVRTKLAEGKKGNKLTRHDFPLGSAGILVIQAEILMAGVADISHPHETSVADFSDVRVQNDGSLRVRSSLEGFKDDPNYSDNRLRRRMGTTMTEAMTAAFACELAMKAICLTCKDEAIKTHDLMDLYEDLPEQSRRRMRADYPEIAKTLESGRQTFGQWRYFEMNVGEEGMRAMIDVQKARALGKAARVILDEAAMMGLDATVKMRAKRNVRIVADTEVQNQAINLKITGGESPPRSDGD